MKKVLLIDAMNSSYELKDAMDKAMGGSELAFASLVEELKKREDIELHTWFVNQDPPKIAEQLDDDGEPVLDYVVALRAPAPLLWVKAKRYVLWTQDYCSDQQLGYLRELISTPRKLRIIFLSHAQRIQYMKMLPELKNIPHHMWDNGIHTEVVEEIDLMKVKKEKQFIYASHPVRGLEALVDAWPKIHEGLPDWKLVICGGCFEYEKEDRSFKFNETYKPEEQEMYKRILEKLKGLKNVELGGALGLVDLYREIAKSSALLYPNTLKIETSCTILHQALYCGAVPLVSCMPCMPEFIVNGESGFVLWGDPNGEEFPDAYAQFVVDTVKSGRLPQVDKATRGQYKQWHWDRLADDFYRGVLDLDSHTTCTEKVLISVITRKDRGEKRGLNWHNLTWMDGYQVQCDEIVGYPIDHARDLSASKVLFGGADWLLFLDDDVFVDTHFVPEMIERARKHNAEVVAADYYYKTDKPYSVSSVVDINTRKRIDWSEMTEEEVNDTSKYEFQMCGLGAVLISAKALETIGRPWFRITSVEHGALFGEDFKFFQDCHALGIKVWFAKDVPAIHVDLSTGKAYGPQEYIDLITPKIGGSPMKTKAEGVMDNIMQMYDNDFNMQRIDISQIPDADFDDHPMKGQLPDEVLMQILAFKKGLIKPNLLSSGEDVLISEQEVVEEL